MHSHTRPGIVSHSRQRTTASAQGKPRRPQAPDHLLLHGLDFIPLERALWRAKNQSKSNGLLPWTALLTLENIKHFGREEELPCRFFDDFLNLAHGGPRRRHDRHFKRHRWKAKRRLVLDLAPAALQAVEEKIKVEVKDQDIPFQLKLGFDGGMYPVKAAALLPLDEHTREDCRMGPRLQGTLPARGRDVDVGDPQAVEKSEYRVPD